MYNPLDAMLVSQTRSLPPTRLLLLPFPGIGACFLHPHSINNRHLYLVLSVGSCTTVLDTILVSHTPFTTYYCTPYVGAHFLHSHSIDNRHLCLASSVGPCTTILDTVLISHTPSTIYHLLLYSLPMSQASGRKITGLSKSIIKHGSRRSLRTIDVLKAGKQIQ
jgi:hypothetical protein